MSETQTLVAPPPLDINREADSALADLDDAATIAAAMLSESSGETTPKSGAKVVQTVPIVDSELLSPEDAKSIKDQTKADDEIARKMRAAAFIQRANRQKDAGFKELQRDYVALAIEFDLVLYDVNVASSAERFLGLVDRANFIIGRSGQNILGEQSWRQVVDSLGALTDNYVAQAAEAMRVSTALIEDAKNESFDWIEPSYASSAFNLKLRLKHRNSVKLAKAMMQFDEAIKLLSIAEWNGKAEGEQVSVLRKRERNLFKVIFVASAKSMIGLQKKSRLPTPQ